MLIIGMGIHKDNDKPKMIEKKELFFWVGKEQNGPTANGILYYIHFEFSKELLFFTINMEDQHIPLTDSPLRPNCK